MKKACVIAIIVSFVSLFVNTQEIEVKTVVSLARFPKGSGEGQFGIDESPAGSYPSKPTSVAFDDKGYLYIDDCMNYRMQVFDHDFKNVRSIEKFGYFDYMKVDSEGVISGYNQSSYSEIDGAGNKKVALIFEKTTIASTINKIGNVYFWEDETGEIVGFINPGSNPVVNQSNWKKGAPLLSALSRFGAQKQVGPSLSGTVARSGSSLMVPSRPQDQGTKILLGGRIVSRRLKDVLLLPSGQTVTGKYSTQTFDEKTNHLLTRRSSRYLGTDKIGRTYWVLADGTCLLLNVDGSLFKFVSFDRVYATPPFVSKEGDLYFLKYVESESQFHLMKVVRDW